MRTIPVAANISAFSVATVHHIVPDCTLNMSL